MQQNPQIEDYKQPICHGGLRCQGLSKYSNSKNPLISIVTVVFNAEKTIEATIQSVLNQSYRNIEYIIVDGCSNDNTLNIVRRYENVIDCFVSEKDKGIYDAMNKGISLCTGDIIGILNSGDIYELDALSEVIECYEKNLNSLICGNVKQLLDTPLRWVILSGTLKNLPYKVIPHPAAFVPISLYKKYGIFDTTLKLGSDYDFFCRCFIDNINFIHLDKTLTNMSPRGASGNYYLVALEHFKIRLKYQLSIVQSVTKFSLSLITITGHFILEKVGLWTFVESKRHNKVIP